MIRKSQSLTTASILSFFVIFSPTTALAESEETLPTPRPPASTDSPSMHSAATPRRVIVYPTYRYQANPHNRSPVQIYRNGQYGRHFGDYYRDRNGGFFYGYDSRYRFGIHR